MKPLMQHFKNLLLYGGLTKNEYDAAKLAVNESNTEHLKLYSLMATCFFALMTWINQLVYAAANVNEVAYEVAGLVMALVALMTRDRKAIMQSPMVGMVLRYLFYAVFYAFSIYLAWQHPKDSATTFIVCLAILPLMFTEVPLRSIIMTLIAGAVYAPMPFMFKVRRIAYLDLWNVITFSVVAVILAFGTAKVRFQVFSQELELKRLSEMDVLTNTYNRNKFEQDHATHPNHNAARIAYVYGDVNGLHELNNNLGHLAGDKMLQTVAAAMTEAFGEGNVYRMGGDEFLAFVPGVPIYHVKETIKTIEAKLAEAGYHVSFGVAQAERSGNHPLDADTALVLAEQRMYDAKRAYYKARGEVDSRVREA